MPSFQNILVVDSDSNGRMLFVATLLRTFPQAALVEVQDFQTAVNLVGGRHYDLIVAHRAIGADGTTLVRTLRETDATVRILAVSGASRKQEVLDAGANRFLNSQEWLTIGTVAQEMLSAPLQS